MKTKPVVLQAQNKLTKKSILAWRIVQAIVWSLGIGMLIALIFFPTIGIHAFWNVLIPIAPALLVVATGLWRNICPLGTTALLPRHLGISKQKRLKLTNHGKIALVGLALLLILVPFRHVILDTNGPATAYLIIALAVAAVYMGYNYNWKSGWCSGLCPIHPVEKLYGSKVAITLPNAHCDSCMNCLTPCSDSIPGMNPLEAKRNKYHKLAGILMIGGFPGYIWGWFQVPDYAGMEGFSHLGFIYGVPFLGFFTTLLLYVILTKNTKESSHLFITQMFATAAVATYYWFRIPALFGFGIYHQDGMLVDLSSTLPYWFPSASQLVTTLFFIWFIMLRKQVKQWTIRPPYREREKRRKSLI